MADTAFALAVHSSRCLASVSAELFCASLPAACRATRSDAQARALAEVAIGLLAVLDGGCDGVYGVDDDAAGGGGGAASTIGDGGGVCGSTTSRSSDSDGHNRVKSVKGEATLLESAANATLELIADLTRRPDLPSIKCAAHLARRVGDVLGPRGLAGRAGRGPHANDVGDSHHHVE